MIDLSALLASSDDEEDDELGNSDIREVYKQHQNNMRAFAVLRFRHFTTFAVLMAFIATIAVQSLSALIEQQYASGVGFVIIVLFWTLDFRSGEYLKYHAAVAATLEKKFFELEKRVDFSLPSFPSRTWLSATRTTNLVFLTILMAWLGFAFSLPNTRSNYASQVNNTDAPASVKRGIQKIGHETRPRDALESRATSQRLYVKDVEPKK